MLRLYFFQHSSSISATLWAYFTRIWSKFPLNLFILLIAHWWFFFIAHHAVYSKVKQYIYYWLMVKFELLQFFFSICSWKCNFTTECTFFVFILDLFFMGLWMRRLGVCVCYAIQPLYLGAVSSPHDHDRFLSRSHLLWLFFFPRLFYLLSGESKYSV